MAGTIRERDAGQKTAARIRSILASRDLTLHQVSRRIGAPLRIGVALVHSAHALSLARELSVLRP